MSGREELEEVLVESTEPDISAMSDEISSDLFDRPAEEDSAAQRDDGTPAPVPAADGPARTPDGKFAPKSVVPDGEVTPGPTPDAPPVSTNAATGELLQAPKTWRKEAAEAFSSLPAMVQAEIVKREQDIFRGIEQYKSHAQVGQVFDSALKPFIPLFQRFNLNPADAAKRALTAHFNLTLSSPAAKVGLARSLLSDYGISLESLGVPAAIPGEGGQPAVNPLMEQEIQHLRAQLSQVSETTTMMQRRHLEQVHSQVRGDVEKFASDPANLYFNELTADMEQLIRSGAAPDLPAAYEKAIWLNPAVRAKEIARLSAQQSASSNTATAAKIDAARKATAVNVRSQSHPANTPKESLGSMDDTLTETMKHIKARG